MGLGAMKQSDMEEYIRVVMALLDGETPEFEIEGKRQKITFLNPELKLINLRDEVKLHVSAYGPRGRALTARLGAGWLNFVGDVTERRRGDAGDAGKAGTGRQRHVRPDRRRLRPGLRAATGRGGGQRAGDGPGRPAGRGAAAPRGG